VADYLISASIEWPAGSVTYLLDFLCNDRGDEIARLHVARVAHLGETSSIVDNDGGWVDACCLYHFCYSWLSWI